MQYILHLKCNDCGYKVDIRQEERDNYLSCPICQKGFLFEEKDILKIEKTVDEYLIEGMKKQLEKLGNAKAWEVIERFSQVKTRLVYRRLFFKAGGSVPETEIL
jgi:DNA-directed RNA polymerase subunit RPC12/RpoP